MSVAPQVDVPILGRVLQARPQEPPEVYSNLLPPSVGETTGGIQPMPSGINISAPPEVNIPKAPQVDAAPQVNTAPRGRKTVGKQPKAPQVIVLILGWKIAGTSAGATGGILKCTPAVEAIAPQVVF